MLNNPVALRVFLQYFPFSTRQWIILIEHEISATNFPAAQDLFTEAFKYCMNVEICQFYIRAFVRNPQQTSTTEMITQVCF
jgi:hypothetical protein